MMIFWYLKKNNLKLKTILENLYNLFAIIIFFHDFAVSYQKMQ